MQFSLQQILWGGTLESWSATQATPRVYPRRSPEHSQVLLRIPDIVQARAIDFSLIKCLLKNYAFVNFFGRSCGGVLQVGFLGLPQGGPTSSGPGWVEPSPGPPRHTQGAPKEHPEHTQSTPRVHPGHTQGAPRMHQCTARVSPGCTQSTPWVHPRRPSAHPSILKYIYMLYIYIYRYLNFFKFI